MASLADWLMTGERGPSTLRLCAAGGASVGGGSSSGGPASGPSIGNTGQGASVVVRQPVLSSGDGNQQLHKVGVVMKKRLTDVGFITGRVLDVAANMQMQEQMQKQMAVAAQWKQSGKSSGVPIPELMQSAPQSQR